MNELDNIKIANYTAGANEAYGVMAQALQQTHDQRKRKNYTIPQVLAVINSAQSQHMTNIAANTLELEFPQPKEPVKKARKARKATVKKIPVKK